ncbi:MAG: hypothetical protein GXP55_18385 [Deltaproteobacteria bacterium]|nr:hypothetical protein [Deltaproteobacteria bacterium]
MPSILDTVKDLGRLKQIVGVLTRHGFGEFVERSGLGALLPGKKKRQEEGKRSLAVRIRLVIQDLGPSFIKLGQVVSTRPDLLPADIITELKKLQDDVPPESFEAIRTQIESEMGRPLEEVYESFSEEPLASASIGQVHRAVLRTEDGPMQVVAKVQRPGVRETMSRDVDLLYWLAHAVERSIPEMKVYNPVKMVAEFDRAISAELDFALEADNAERFAENFAEMPFARFPKVYREASAKRLLTLEFLDGKKVYAAVEAGVSGELIAKRSLAMIMKQIYEDGLFHADPHPGNILILGPVDDPQVAMIDLGMVGRLTPVLRDRTVDLMVACVREDYPGIADSLYAIGHPTRKVDRAAFEAEVTQLGQQYLGKRLQDIEISAMIRDFAYGARKYGIEIPADFLMLGKALMTVEGVGKELYPDLDVFEELKPYFLKLLGQRYSPERITQDVLRSIVRVSGAANQMPLQLEEILEDLRKGSFEIQVHERHLQDTADRMGRRLFGGLVTSAGIIAGALLLSSEHYWLGGIGIALAMGYASLHNTFMIWLERRHRKLPG